MVANFGSVSVACIEANINLQKASCHCPAKMLM